MRWIARFARAAAREADTAAGTGNECDRKFGPPDARFLSGGRSRPRLKAGVGKLFAAVALVSGMHPLGLSGQRPSSELLETTYRQAEQAFREKRLEAAAAGYEKLAELSPKTAEVHAKLGLIYFLQGRFGDAVPSFRAALGMKPGVPNVSALLAMSLAELGRHADALPGLEEGFENPAAKDLRRLIGLQLQRSYLALDRVRDAGRIMARLSALYPDDPEILYHAGRYHADRAATAMRRLLDIAPHSVWGRQAAAEALDSRGNHELAIIEYRKVLAEQPGRPGAHYSIARAIQASAGKSGSQDDALDEYRKELQVDPSNALAAYEAGEILRKRSRLAAAREFFQQAVSQRPNFALGRVALGRVLRELDDPRQARTHLEAAVRLAPENEVARYQLALIYRALGDLAAAQREMQRFQQLQQGRPATKDRVELGLETPEATPQLLDSTETGRR